MPPNPPNNTPPDPTALDTTTASAQNASAALDKLNQFLRGNTQQMDTFNEVTKLANLALGNLATDIQDIGRWFRESADFTKQQADMFEVLAASALGASKAFSSLQDNTGIEGFSEQLEFMVKSAAGARDAVGALMGVAKQFGLKVPPEALASVDKLKEYVLGAAKNLGQATDAALHFQQAFTQMLISSGQAEQLFTNAGQGLEYLDNMMQKQGELITDVYGVTGVALPTLTAFYNTLGRNVPGALEEMAPAVGAARGEVTLFQAAIELAHGSGKGLEEVNKDLSTAFEVLGKSGQDALEFIGRMAELSERFKIPISETTGFINHAADSFKFLGDNTRGATQIFTDFFGMLREGGLGVRPSIDIINQVTDSISKMSTAQRAFLSSRTGGPGGLLGAVQIERELRSGNAADVFNKMRDAFLQQVGGRVITQGQVTTQQQAAEFERQRLLLQSGAFGGMATTEDQATRILEVLSKPPTATSIKEQTQLLNDLRTRGSTVEQQSVTELRSIKANTEYLKMLGGIRGLQYMQEGFGIRGDNAPRLQMGAANFGARGAQAAAATPASQDQDLENAREAFGAAADSLGGVTSSLETASETAHRMFIGPQSSQQIAQETQQQYAMMFSEIQAQRERTMAAPTGAMSKEEKELALRKLQAEEDMLKASQERALAGATGTRGRAVGGAAQAVVQTHNANQMARETSGGPAPAYAPGGRAGQKLDLTVNVYVGGKKQTNQHVVDLESGAPGTVNSSPVAGY